MMIRYYVLNEAGQPELSNLMEMAEWCEKHEGEGRNPRQICDTRVNNIRLSTIFLMLDHNYNATNVDDPAILFETMLFGGPIDQCWQFRYYSRAEAEENHEDIASSGLIEFLAYAEGYLNYRRFKKLYHKLFGFQFGSLDPLELKHARGYFSNPITKRRAAGPVRGAK